MYVLFLHWYEFTIKTSLLNLKVRINVSKTYTAFTKCSYFFIYLQVSRYDSKEISF